MRLEAAAQAKQAELLRVQKTIAATNADVAKLREANNEAEERVAIKETVLVDLTALRESARTCLQG